MNERIRQLARDSYMVEVVCSQKSVKVNYPKNFEKFAELIVQECAMACEKNSYLALNGWQRAKQIRKHFGVEE